MRKYFYIILFFLASTLTGLAQQYVAMLNVYSLKKVLLNAKDTQRINTLNLLSMRIYLANKRKVI